MRPIGTIDAETQEMVNIWGNHKFPVDVPSGAGHILHMPGHIYIRVGQYEKAVLTNRGSLAADPDVELTSSRF